MAGSGSGWQGGRTAAQAWAGLGAWAGWWLAWPGGWLSPGLAAGAWLVAWQEALAFCLPKASHEAVQSAKHSFPEETTP